MRHQPAPTAYGLQPTDVTDLYHKPSDFKGTNDMATATFIHNGVAIDYTPTVNVPAGAVIVQGELIGMTRTPIAANTLGSLAVEGVFDIAKATGTGTAIAAGANCYWNATTSQATTVATGNKLLGKCIQAAADADAIVRVRLSQ